MAWPESVLLLGCALVCGCAESTAPAQADLSGRWNDVFSLSGQSGTTSAWCSGVLYLTLTQTDTLLIGQIDAVQSLEATSCYISGYSGPFGIPAPFTVAGTVTVGGGLHLTVEFFPDSLVFDGGRNPSRLSGVATSTFSVSDTSGTTISVPLVGAYELVRVP
jgi:hypothetical protein